VGEWDELEVGMGGVGRVYRGHEGEEDDEEDDEEDEHASNLLSPAASGSAAAAAAAGGAGCKLARVTFKASELNSIAPNPAAVAAWLSKARPLGEESEDEWDEIPETDEDDGSGVNGGLSNDPSLANQLGSAPVNLHFYKFAMEVGETLKRGHDEKLPLDDISLEMSGLKFSHNTNVEEFAHATFLALFHILNEQFNKPAAAAVPLDPIGNKAVMQSLGMLLKTWHPVLKKFADKQPDQVYMLAGLEQACLASGYVSPPSSAGTPSHAAASSAADLLSAATDASAPSIYTPLFTPVLQLMYNNFGVFSEEAVLAWAEQAREAEGDSYVLLKQASSFLQWLEEAEEEEDEDEEDED
jgi:translation initiation factor eIF-2B subunit epsilon